MVNPSDPQAATSITASLVPATKRLAFLPKYFGPRLMLRGESLVYDWLKTLCNTANCAYWEFYELSNGGFYLAPDIDARLHLTCENGFDDEVSADAAGIAVTLYALGQLTSEMEQSSARDELIDRYYFLRDFAITHAESASILAIID